MATGFQTTLLLLTLATTTLYAQETAKTEKSPQRRIGIIFGGTFEGFEVTGPLDGAKKTQLAAFYEWDFGVRPFTKKVWDERKLEWEKFFPLARALADSIAERVAPNLVRDDRGVALYAVLGDEDPFLTSAILSPKLHERFRESLGDRIHAILLERNRIYLFPATGGTLAEFGPALIEEYRVAQFPVSLEVFLLDREGYRVVGELERDPNGGATLEP